MDENKITKEQRLKKNYEIIGKTSKKVNAFIEKIKQKSENETENKNG